MTNSEARQILIEIKNLFHGLQYITALNAAIVALGDYKKGVDYQSGYFAGKRSKSSIAQAIRYAAVNWPQFVGNVEGEILDAFIHWHEPNWADELHFDGDKVKARTFMLLVAEALES